jgi:pimeloyl-ACP methyl ester carboxylesterase
MPTVNVNGCDFRYELKGRGPDLVFIHGEIHGASYWEHQIEAFSRDYRCLAYDRRGHAGSSSPGFGYSVANQARDLELLLDRFGIERPVIVALAFGTAIAANFAIDHPERVRGMLVAAWSEMHDAREYLSRWENSGRRAAEALESGGREALVALLRKEGGKTMFQVIPPEGSPLREPAIQLLASHPADEYRRGMLEMASSVPVLIPRFATLGIPVVGVCGTEDPFPDQPERLATMQSFREAPRIEGGGRFLHWEQPQAFNTLLRNFIETLP